MRLEGFELSAHGLEVRCSIQLSYRRILLTMCQKDLASYRLRLLLSRPNADEPDNDITGMKPQSKLRSIIPSALRDCSTYQFRCASLSELEFQQ